MQPYQEASKENRRQGELPLKIAKNIGATAASIGTAFLGGSAINRVLPFLSKYVPENLAIKGLNKVDPRYGKFIQKAMAAGQSFNDVKEFIGSKIEEQTKPTKEDRNIIKQYSDELSSFLENHINQGRQPIEAGALAQLDPKYKKVISRIEADHKTPWSSILQSVYGGANQAQPNQSKAALQPQVPQQAQMQAQGRKTQNDPLQEALMTGDIQQIMKIQNINEKAAQRYLQNYNQSQGGQSQGMSNEQLLAAMQNVLSM